MMRRRRQSKGFVMAEALVALAIGAMTIALLTSATWGLNAASERRAASQQTTAVDWLAARRVLTDWAAGVTARGPGDSQTSFVGTAATARMTVMPSGTGQLQPFVGELQVVALGEEQFALVAARHIGVRDARVTANTPQSTEILRTNAPMRLLYLMPRGVGGVASAWRYESGSGDAGLPLAIGVEVGTDRMLTTRIFATTSASCLARLGRGGLSEDQCELR